ncbi:MAG: DUF748 domain-containing protein [Candidatus Tantalella remota]|nr:DUF748 domain-containing protein [Candidatus Tantalella remota]
MKVFGIILLVIFVVAISAFYIFRYDIFQFSAETIIKKLLPDYVHVDRIIFDLENNVLKVDGFGLRNPKGFQNRYLASIETIVCHYKMKGKNILDGIEVTKLEGRRPVINIERLPDDTLNLTQTGEMMKKEGAKETSVTTEDAKTGKKDIAGRKLSDMVKLPGKIDITDGKITFLDRAVMRRPYYLTFENVNGDIGLSLNSDYTEVMAMSTNGTGYVSGDNKQRIDWIVSMNPQTPELSMGNRFEVQGVDLMLFKPYYDRYLPVDIQRGNFSGTLVCDFDNGNVGSTNTIVLKNLQFVEKQGGGGSGAFWDVSITDVVKYLETSSGDIVFDFKVKGTMENPRFFPGPRVKQAMQSMIVKTVTDLLKPKEEGAAEGAAEGSALPAAEPKSDAERVVDIIQGLMNQ